jgi:hypothetical protein
MALTGCPVMYFHSGPPMHLLSGLDIGFLKIMIPEDYTDSASSEPRISGTTRGSDSRKCWLVGPSKLSSRGIEQAPPPDLRSRESYQHLGYREPCLDRQSCPAPCPKQEFLKSKVVSLLTL